MPNNHILTVNFDKGKPLKPLAIKIGAGLPLANETLSVEADDNLHFSSRDQTPFSLFFPNTRFANDNDSYPAPTHPLTGGDVFNSKEIVAVPFPEGFTEGDTYPKKRIEGPVGQQGVRVNVTKKGGNGVTTGQSYEYWVTVFDKDGSHVYTDDPDDYVC